MDYTKVRHLPKKYGSVVSTITCGSAVIMVIYNKATHIIEINNKEIANSYSQYFELLWKCASK